MIAVSPEIEYLVRNGSPVAFGVSGGKDSDALVLLANRWLDEQGHPRSKRILIHAHLGEIEWTDSLPHARRLAEHVGLELVVVERPAGGMIERWQSRWASSVLRYRTLRCVCVIPPWSTPAMRFCTSELKVAPITAELRRRWPGETIISANGIRREESSGRKQAPISKPNPRLLGKRAGTSGIDWQPLVDVTFDQVIAAHEEASFPLHEAYTQFDADRVSCVLCIMGSERGLLAAAKDERNYSAIRKVADLELISGFSFQSGRWIVDLLSKALTKEQRAQITFAKYLHSQRATLEARIPDDLLYVKGWPLRVPTESEALLLSEVRTAVSKLMGFSAQYLDPFEIQARYAELMIMKEAA